MNNSFKSSLETDLDSNIVEDVEPPSTRRRTTDIQPQIPKTIPSLYSFLLLYEHTMFDHSSQNVDVDGPSSLLSVHANRSVPFHSRCESPQVRARDAHFPTATDAQWDDWRWQSRHRIQTLAQFEAADVVGFEREALLQGGPCCPSESRRTT